MGARNMSTNAAAAAAKNVDATGESSTYERINDFGAVRIWFFKAMPSRLGTLLDMKTTSLEKIIYFQDYVVIDPGQTPLKERQLLTEDEFKHYRQEYGDAFEVDMGAEAVKKLLERLN